MTLKINFNKTAVANFKLLSVLLGTTLLLMFLTFVFRVNAADTANVTATVTAQNVSVSVTDGSVAYGTMGTSSSKTTAINDGDALTDSQTATNGGNVTVTLNIMGVDSAAWELGDAAGSETYSHKFCTTNCDATPSWTAFNEDGYTQLATGITASGTQDFDLQLGTPTSTATYTQQTVSATIQAVAE